jgi:hypothetical protein
MALLNAADDVRIGGDQVDRVYLGTALVWEREASEPGYGYGLSPYGNNFYGYGDPTGYGHPSRYGIDPYGL